MSDLVKLLCLGCVCVCKICEPSKKSLGEGGVGVGREGERERERDQTGQSLRITFNTIIVFCSQARHGGHAQMERTD